MADERRYEEGQALLGRERNGSWSSSEASHTFASDVEMHDFEDAPFRASQSSRPPKLWARPRTNSKITKPTEIQQQQPRARRKRSRYHRLCRLALHVPYLMTALLVVTAVFFPSYTTPPQQYRDLRRRVQESTREGSANPRNEKVFIAASLHDGDGGLLRGDWGGSVLHLIDMLGHDNVFVSIYENDPSETALLAMSDFQGRLPCASSVVHETLDTSEMHHVMTADGKDRLKRIAFLADVRNRALQPLEDEKSEAYNTTWDKLLYLNDVIFDPMDAANLLFNTNADERTGRTDYRAACAVDFVNPFKFYDTFATRDLESYDMGVPFYPWFTKAGEGQSRQDVLDQKDAVRVKSCWGGMVAFEAKWFQQGRNDIEQGEERPADQSATSPTASATEKSTLADAASRGGIQAVQSAHAILARSANNSATSLLRFRSEPDTFWDASECCLIHADLTRAAGLPLGSSESAGIYMNPYVRVAYDRSTLAWLPFTRRFERLYTHVHNMVDWIGSRPRFNPRQFEQPGEEVVHQVWRWDDQRGNATALTGSYVEEKMTATPGMFCGTRKLLYLKEGEEAGKGGKNWGSEAAPALPPRG